MRIKVYPIFLITALVFFAEKSSSQSGIYGNNILTERPNTPINEMINGFIEVVPVSYNNAANSTKKYPLLIFLEGNGEFGNGSSELQALYSEDFKNMIPSLVRRNLFLNSYEVGGTTHEFIVITPQIRPQVQEGRPDPEKMASPSEVNDIINYALQNYRVDVNRVYLAGLSLGGGSIWNYAGQSVDSANRLAAIVTFAGASDLDDNTQRDDNIAAAKLPVWTFVGSSDEVYRPLAEQYINAINAHPEHGEALITLGAGGDHFSWIDPLGGVTMTSGSVTNNIYQWMLSHSRPRPSLTQPVFANVDAGPTQVISLTNGSMMLGPNSISFSAPTVTLQGSATSSGIPIANIQWKRVDGNGSTVTNPNSAISTVTGLKPGSYTYQLRVRDDQNLLTVDNVKVEVIAPPENKYKKIEAENYSGVNTGTPPLISRTVIDEGPSYGLGWWEPGKWAEYTVPLATPGLYALYYRYVSPGGINVDIIVDNGRTYPRTLTPGSTWRSDSVHIFLTSNSTIKFLSQGSGWGFNYFELALLSSESPLPVKFEYFNARCNSGVVNLQWSTSFEQNASRFAIERSTDGINWSEIGTLAAAGQSTQQRRYLFEDKTPSASNSLYRVVEYDYNGRTTISSIVRSSCTSRYEISLYPNPSSDNASVNISLEQSTKVTLRIVDSKGAVMQQIQRELPAGNSTIPLNISSYAKGVYNLTVHYNNEVKTIKMIKK